MWAGKPFAFGEGAHDYELWTTWLENQRGGDGDGGSTNRWVNEASTTNPINQAMMVLGLITMRSHLRCSMINFGGGTDGYST